MEEPIIVYNEPCKILLPTDIFNQCVEFADKSTSSSELYIKKRMADPAKVKPQILQGKLAEFATAIFLATQLGFPELDPDLTIYKAREKSWAADLPYSTVDESLPDVHVKSADTITAARYDESYVFELKDTLFRRQKDRDLIAMVLYNASSGELTVRALAKWSYICEKQLFGEMKVHQLRSSKVCIYYKDLENAILS